VILFAWLPLLIWEIAGSGHLDSAVFAFVTLALLARWQRKPVLTGVFLALAVLTKFYPLVLFPALYLWKPAEEQGESHRSLAARLEWRMPLTMLAIAVPSYALYASVGKKVFGFLGGYVQEEGMQTGERYFLLEQAQHLPGLHALPTAAYLVFATLILGGLSIWALRCSWSEDMRTNRAGFLVPTTALAFALMLLFSPHYPWYVAWLAPLFALLPWLPLGAYLLGLFYLCTTALAVGSGPKQFLLNQILYGIVAVATLLHLALRRAAQYRRLIPL
jgi:hypothetical protein